MRLFLTLATTLLLTTAAAEELPTYSGTWVNRLAGTTGNLAVVAVHVEEDKWKAKFVGEFQGERFEYDVTFKATKSKAKKGKADDKLKLKGTTNVNGQLYTWSGHMNEETFYGKYRSSSANGDFRLSRIKS